MGKKSSSAPKSPDPVETATAEAQANRINTYNADGSGTRWGYTDANGNFVQSTDQTLINSGQAAQQYVESDTASQLRSILEPASVSLTQQFTNDALNMPEQAVVQDRGDVADQIFNRTFSLMSPAIDKSNEKLITNLQARGMPVGSEAFNDAYGEQLAQTQDTISRLAMDADINAGQEQSRQFALDSQARANSMSELMALMGGSYTAPVGQASGTGAGVNVAGQINQNYQSELNAYNQQQQQNTATASAIGSIGAAMIKSSMHAKIDHGEVPGEWSADIVAAMPQRIWEYTPEHAPNGDTRTHIGPMAEHFHKMTGLGIPTHIHVADYLGLLMSALQNALHRIEVLEKDRYGIEVH